MTGATHRNLPAPVTDLHHVVTAWRFRTSVVAFTPGHDRPHVVDTARSGPDAYVHDLPLPAAGQR